ncbi:CHAT domain-containing protein [Xylariaceae sp. FL0255]|nr:CHAT domain-containing protein [Xylariaceae sp. FL0255]
MAGEKLSEAIVLLELGRGVIASTRYDMPTVISVLREQHPQVAGEYVSLRDQLESQDGETYQIDPQDLSDSTDYGDQRYNVSQKLEQKIQKIRKLPGFDRFLLGPDEDELKAAAIHGPIVVINVSRYRCDALIIETSLIRAVQLPRLLIKDIRDRAQTLANSQSLKPEIPTGLLAKLPIHAAGRHSDQSLHTVLDRAISSYSASVRALVHSRQNLLAATMPDEPGEPGNIVLVGMEKTPGQSTLRFVPQEIQELEKLCDSSQLRVIKPRPCRNDVLSALQDCKVFHFAGHGYSNPSDPSLSSLLLSDDSLTVASLIETNLQSRRPFLAYLSACGTGQVKHNELLDEGLHLISACQLAGFQHVVGTLWEVNDELCIEAAIKTYEWMQKQHMSDDSVSEALHRASRNLRDRWISENAMRGPGASSKCIMTGVTKSWKDGGQVLVEQSRLGQGKAREPRDVELCDDDIPLYWVPFVHFGI